MHADNLLQGTLLQDELNNQTDESDLDLSSDLSSNEDDDDFNFQPISKTKPITNSSKKQQSTISNKNKKKSN